MKQEQVRICEGTDSVRELVELVMRAGAPLAAEYPLVFRRGHGAAFAVVEEDGRPVSACALLPREFVVDGAPLRVGLVGSVVTHPEHRGRGLASRVLEAAEAELSRRGCLLAALWAEDSEYYALRGWRPWGSELDFVLPRELAAHLPDPVGVRLARPSDAAAIHRLYATHRRRVVRTRAETEALLSVPGMDVLVRERDGETTAYSCLGRGGDLKDAIHEWAGGAEDMLALVRMHLDLRETLHEPRDLFLMAADEPQDPFLAALIDAGVPSARGVLGMAKVVDPRAACEMIVRRHARPGLELRWHASTGHRGAFVFDCGGRSVTLAPAELLDLLVAPRGDVSTAKAFAAQLGLAPVPPLRPFAWGLDSI